ncbi:MAG: hypothetical protein N3C13_00860 [Aquificaceae bacterium]|nr:hypothetical protein [Aquificaceae bacterium]
MSQETNPMYLSEYAQKVLEFRNYAFLQDTVDGHLLIRGGGNLRTLRVEGKVHVDMLKSKGVVGYRHHENRTYVNLDSSGEYRLVLSGAPPSFNLVSSNGRVKHFSYQQGVYKLRLVSHVPLELEVRAPQCQINLNPKGYSAETSGDTLRIRYREQRDAELEARCKG